MPLRWNDPALWANMPGVIAAYQAIAAPDELSARVNMAYGGDSRYRCESAGTQPTWQPVLGWHFSGGSWNTGAVLQSDATIIIRYSSAATTDSMVAGSFLSSRYLRIRPYYSGNLRMYYGNDSSQPTTTILSGIVGLAANTAYVNGINYGTFGGTWTGINSESCGIGGRYNGTFVNECDVQAAAIYARTLTSAEMWLAYLQMAYCESNSAWNVWAPQRRWFFVPPPPPAAATPVLSTIYINTADIGDTSLFDDVSGAAVSSTYARTGTYSFKLDGTDYLQADLTSSATKYSKFGLLVTDTPASDALLVAWQETGTEHVSLYLTDKFTLQMRQGSTIIQTSPTTLEVDTWYCVETKIVVHTTTGRFQVRIDGVDDMEAIGINTDADVDGVINEIRFEAPVNDTYIDDIVVREDQWCGTGGVYVVVPTAAGTVEEWTGAYTDVDDLPPSFTDYIEATAESGVDHVFRHGELAGDYDISIVGMFAMGRLDSAIADTVFNGLARVGTTDHAGDAQDLDTIGVYARVLMTANPDGSVAWTTHAVNNALQIGVRT